MNDKVFENALALVPNRVTIYDKSRGDLAPRLSQFECISAAWFLNNDGRNHREALQQAINAPRAENISWRYVIIPNIKMDWLLDGQIEIFHKKRMTILLEEGVRISAALNAFLKPTSDNTDYMFTIVDGEDISLHGQIPETGKLRPCLDLFPKGDNDDRWGFIEGTRDKGKRSGIALIHPQERVSVRNFDITRTCGDGIYVGGGNEITVDNMRISENLRNNMSVIGTGGLTVTNSRFDRAYSSWSAGIDIEPNPGHENVIEGVVIRDCQFDNNPAGGLTISFEYAKLDRKHTVLVERCLVRALHPKMKNGVVIGPIPFRKKDRWGNEGFVEAECVLNEVEVRGATCLGYYITRPESPTGLIELNNCVHQEVNNLDLYPAGEGIDDPAIIGVNGKNNHDDPDLMDANSKILVREMEFRNSDGHAIPQPIRRDMLERAHCRSGSITINGTQYPLPH